MSPLLRLPYRALQKLAVFEINHTLVAETQRIGERSSRPGVQRLSYTQLLHHFKRDETPGCWPYFKRLPDRVTHCYGVVEGERLVAFAWVNEGEAEPCMNYGYHPGTAAGIELQDNAAFLFHVYTAPDARGRGWMGELLRHTAHTLREERGIESLVTTTEIINRPAIGMLTKTGFERRGRYCRFGLGSWATGWYPRPVAPIVAFN